ncbi:hypothetical protein B9H04_06795 [Halorubrum ezzemoulense DSM 17463]|uniref:Uncharacterized protein n=1 Tax=Halorubrum ezzemoulense DSM 17463 TaxID=1121945 RepID=A0A1X4H8P3_HALEZ|nr:hypothetical protein B9H04_06795 [Halorubrum ezzemoulense DSM 17463]
MFHGTFKSSSPAVVDGVVYFSVSELSAGWLLAVDARTGSLNWTFEL